MKTLEKIVPTPIRIDVAGERLSLTPIKTRELPAMMRAIEPILADVGSAFNLDANDGEDSVDFGAILKMFSANADAIVTAVSIGSRKPREWVDDLDIDDLAALAGAIIESNADFFVRRVMPILTTAIESVTRAIGSETTAAGPE